MFNIGGGTIDFTLWEFNIAIESGPFTDDLPAKESDFPLLC
jgi:hypothetical protein